MKSIKSRLRSVYRKRENTRELYYMGPRLTATVAL